MWKKMLNKACEIQKCYEYEHTNIIAILCEAMIYIYIITYYIIYNIYNNILTCYVLVL